MQVNHIGYAVKSLEGSIKKFELLGFQFEKKIIDNDRNLKIQFGQNGEERIELLEVLDKNKPSPIDIYLNKIGPTPYHICYNSDDIEKDIYNLKTNGFSVIIPLQKATAFNGRNVVFLYEKSIGMIELVEKY